MNVRYACRALARTPGFTLIAVAALALGIGANTALFSVVHSVLLKPLPYRDADRIVALYHDNRTSGQPRDAVSYQAYEDFAKELRSVRELAGATGQWSMVASVGAETERVPTQFISASLFRLLGANPAVGRAFSPEDDKPGAPLVAIVSHGWWQRRFGGDPAVITRTIGIRGMAQVSIIGVMPPGFRFPEDADLYLPLAANSLIERGRAVRFVYAFGRLAPDATLEQARAEASAVAARMAQQYPDSNRNLGANLFPLHEEVVGKARPALRALLAGVAFILLIACANVANLLLARAAAREREIAVRAALGASRRTLVGQFLAESLVLAAAGGAAGLLLAWWGIDVLKAFGPAGLPRLQEISLDGTVLAFTAAVAAGTGILFGLAPVFLSGRFDLHESLKESGRSTAGVARGRMRGALVAAEVGLAAMLLFGAGLMIRSFSRLMRVDTGYRAEGVLTLQIMVPESYRPVAQNNAFYAQLFDKLGSLPGVAAVGGITRLPLRDQGVSTVLEIEGRALAPGDRPQVEFRRISPGYLPAMGIPVLRGRAFTEQDRSDTHPVAMVNETLAAQQWPNRNPLGQRVRFFGGNEGPWFTIVGVVKDVKHFGLDLPPRPEVIMPFAQGSVIAPLLAIRTSGDPESLAAAVRREIRAIDQDVVAFNVATMRQLVTKSVAGRRFQMLLTALFAAVALALAGSGVYGVLAYTVSQRTREIGVRMALGARRGNVVALVLGAGMRLALVGGALGVAGALALNRFLKTLLFEVSPFDPWSLLAGAAVLAAATLLACYVPARRAARVDPMVALRYE